MNWDAASAIAEIISAIAVVITLFYLAVQIRQNSRTMISNIREQRMVSTQQIIFKWADEADLLEKIEKNEEVEGAERSRALMIIRAVYRNWESHIHQYRHGLLDEEEWKALYETIRYLRTSDLHREFWQIHKKEFSIYLHEVIDSLGDESAS